MTKQTNSPVGPTMCLSAHEIKYRIFYFFIFWTNKLYNLRDLVKNAAAISVNSACSCHFILTKEETVAMFRLLITHLYMRLSSRFRSHLKSTRTEFCSISGNNLYKAVIQAGCLLNITTIWFLYQFYSISIKFKKLV